MITKQLATIAKFLALALAILATPLSASAADYVIDSKGAHASINFRVSHLGFGWVTGRFDRFVGKFTFDEKDPAKSSIVVEIDPASVNTNHAARDNHIRSPDFLDVARFPAARFVSTSVKLTGKTTADISGKLTLHGVTRDVMIKASHVGGGKDPWGGFRQGFTGETSFTMADFGIKKNLGPTAAKVYLQLVVEGIRQ